MSDELRAAAERMRTKWTSTSKSFDGWGKPHMEYVEDLSIITDAYLAANPADDDEPVTEDWLRSVGWEDWKSGTHLETIVYDRSNPTCLVTQTVITFLLDDNHPHGGVIDSVMLEDPPREYTTRGDVRNLCAALGVSLKEGGGE